MSVTQQNLVDIFYDILREEEQDTSAYPLTLVQLLLDAAQQDLCAWRVINPITRDEARKWVMHFLNTDAYYSNTKTTYLTADTTVGAVTLSADTTDYPTSWYIYIWWQIVSYTWLTTTSFTGVTWVLFAYPAWTQIGIAFAVPADFGSVINVIYNNKFKLPPKQYDKVFEDLNDFKWSNFQRMNITSMYETPYRVKPFYTIKDSAYLIPFQLNTVWDPIHLRYEKTPPAMSSTVWPIIDNDIYAKLCIPYRAVWEMLFNRWEEDRAAKILQVAVSRAKKMYSWYNDTSLESQNNTNYWMAKGKLNI